MLLPILEKQLSNKQEELTSLYEQRGNTSIGTVGDYENEIKKSLCKFLADSLG